jgi:hypothetical protein
MIDLEKLVADTIARDNDDSEILAQKRAAELAARAHYRRSRIVRTAATILCRARHHDRRLYGCAGCRAEVEAVYDKENP